MTKHFFLTELGCHFGVAEPKKNIYLYNHYKSVFDACGLEFAEEMFGSDASLAAVLQDEKKPIGWPYRDNDNVKNAIVRVNYTMISAGSRVSGAVSVY